MTGAGNQGVRDAEVVAEASGAKPDAPPAATGIVGLVQRVLALKPARVFLHFNEENGPLLAAGMAYQAIFALFAGLWLGFSIAGFVIKGDPALRAALFDSLNRTIPGLLSTGGTSGAIDANKLLDSTALGASSIVSVIGLLLTAVGFLGTLRTAVRIMFAVPPPTANPWLLKLKDLGLTIGFGAVVLVTAVISLVSTALLDLVLNLLGIPKDTWLAAVAPGVVGALLILVIDTLLLVAAFRVLSALRVPRGRLWTGAAIGGVGLAALQTLGTSLLGGARSNPLLAGFAVLVGLLIYFNLVATVILLAASWISVGLRDAGVDARDLSTEERAVGKATELEDARRLVADANRHELEDRVRAARGIRRRRLERELQQEIAAEERRREAVPTVTEFREDQRTTNDPEPGADEVAASQLAGAVPTEQRADAVAAQPDGRAGRPS
jgi:membrane protein